MALIAKQIVTFQEISNGRLEFRTRPGATLQYAKQWRHPYRIDYTENSKRVSLFEEGVELLKMIFGESTSSTSIILSIINLMEITLELMGLHLKNLYKKFQ